MENIMKEIIAIIRPKKVEPTKDALEKLGFPSLTAVSVIGRGRQRGIAAELNYEISPEMLSKEKSGGMKYIPKRLITLVVEDEDVDEIIKEIVRVNQTAQIGDGKIFICPIENAVRVRTDESGAAALN
jgi:nitrogen regulatory protein PII 2